MHWFFFLVTEMLTLHVKRTKIIWNPIDRLQLMSASGVCSLRSMVLECMNAMGFPHSA